MEGQEEYHGTLLRLAFLSLNGGGHLEKKKTSSNISFLQSSSPFVKFEVNSYQATQCSLQVSASALLPDPFKHHVLSAQAQRSFLLPQYPDKNDLPPSLFLPPSSSLPLPPSLSLSVDFSSP
jgi:hypothetical protein